MKMRIFFIGLLTFSSMLHGGILPVAPAPGGKPFCTALQNPPSAPLFQRGERGDLIGIFSKMLSIPSVQAMPSYQEVRQGYVKSDSTLLDRHGEIIHELRTDLDRRRLDWIPLQNISPALRESVIAAEDKRFYEHSGIDYRALASAILQGLTSISLRGASTITMQLATRLDENLQSIKGKKSIWQKGKQIFAAREMERGWSKDQILEAYLNLVTYRGELQGIAAASRGLFGKEPHGLDRPESLLLASLIRAPVASSVDLARRAVHLSQSLKWPMEGEEISNKVKQMLMGPHSPKPQVALAPHLARQLLKALPSGTALSCSLDGGIQCLALDLLHHHLLPLGSQNVRDGAILVVENKTGEVLAYVSHSGEPSRARFVDGVRIRRQAGSTLKPFLYALAFDERILTPASLLEDSPLDVPVSGGIYHPRNYEGQFRGPVPARVALASSLNVPAVRTLTLVGEEAFLHKLRALGVRDLQESGDFYGPALALGSADVCLWDLVNAYRALANGGRWSELTLTAGLKKESPPKRVFSPEAAFLVSDILSDREARSLTFGLENPLSTRFWTAVKTGTSKDMRDNWCIGYSPKYTVGVWVGNFSGEAMWNVSGITGAAPVWVEVMNWLHRNEILPRKPAPSGLVKARTEFHPGMKCSGEEWFIRGTEPLSLERQAGPYNQRIVYPPTGTIIALDPDIPRGLQKVLFLLQSPQPGVHWLLDGGEVPSRGKATPWSPEAGKHLLSLKDEEGRVIDSVIFEVRGTSIEENRGEDETPGHGE